MTMIGYRNILIRAARAIRALFRGRSRGGRARHPAWIIAHRGAARVEPENTLPSFARAMELGANGIETDICITADGHFVLWHDANPEGTVALARQSGREELAFVPDVPPPPTSDAEGARPWFRRLRELRDGIRERHPDGAGIVHGDVVGLPGRGARKALRWSAIGTALFGPRAIGRW